MSDAYTGEIRMFGGNFAPAGWLFCDGSLQSISTYDVLFQLLGTVYGGDGESTFGLPDLRGRVPVHQGGGVPMGQTSGSETVTLTSAQLPTHTHTFQGSSGDATLPGPGGNVVATSSAVNAFRQASAGTAMSNNATGPYGGSGPHDNVQPFQCVNFIICTEGYYPPQN